jgi:hypothetical protein
METCHVGCNEHNAATLLPQDYHAVGVAEKEEAPRDITTILIYRCAGSTKMKISGLFSYIFTH